MHLQKVKRTVRTGVANLPWAGPWILKGYWNAALFRMWVLARLRSLKADNLPDPDAIYWLDPARIALHTNFDRDGRNQAPEDRVFDTQRDKGAVKSGDWDISTYRFEDLEVVRALRQRIEEGSEWQKTTFYRQLQQQVRERGVAPWNIYSQRELDEHFAYIDQLIKSIQENGFRRCHEIALQNEAKVLDGHPIFGGEVTVNIGRKGEYLFQDGRHRLAIARILGISRIPVKVLVRHRQWVEFRQYLRGLARGGSGSSRTGQLYQNPVHPDLQDIPFAHKCEDRLAALKEAASRDEAASDDNGSLLDIGANLGYFCHAFEEMGYTCFAVEHMPECARAAERIRDAEGKRFTVIARSLFAASTMAPLKDREFSVVLALNIFHHFLKKREVFDAFCDWLGQLQVETMFFEPHCSEESQMVESFKNFTETDFVTFMLDKSCLNHAELIHRCEDGRPIYRLWR